LKRQNTHHRPIVQQACDSTSHRFVDRGGSAFELYDRELATVLKWNHFDKRVL